MLSEVEEEEEEEDPGVCGALGSGRKKEEEVP